LRHQIKSMISYSQRVQRARIRERTEIHFIDDTQTIRTEVYTGLGFIESSHEVIEDKKEYFKRKLNGK